MDEVTTRLLEARAAQAASRSAALGLSPDDTIPFDPASSKGTLQTPSAFDVDVEDLPHVGVDGLDDRDGEPHPSTGADLIGIATLGQGGMGRVLLARQRSLARDVAVKTLKEGAEPDERAALLREGRVAGSLEHPGIVPVHALGLDARGRPVLVMKRVDGVDWETLLRHPTHGGWAARLASSSDRLEASLEILVRVCQTLEFAHSRGIVHRDVKPANVMVGAFGEVYVVDWGIAIATGSTDRAIVGTPAYMAPEMAAGEPIDERTDVYLLGAVLHRVLVGKPRHFGGSVGEVVVSAAISDPFDYPPSVPAQLAALCNRATAREPSHRPLGVQAFRAELLAFSRDRNAFVLSDAALTSLVSLERLLAGDPGRAPAAISDAYRLGTEARFGFTQCLRTYPEHAAAREGAQKCLAVLIDLELRQGHIDSAAAFLAEIESPDAELVRQVADAREAAQREAAERDRLRAMDRDLDPSVAKRGRTLAYAAVAVVGTAITGFMSIGPAPLAPNGARLMWIAVGLLVLSLSIVAAMRRRIVSNAFNRKFAVVFLLIIAAMLANRTAGWYRNVPVDLTMGHDLLLMLLAAGAGTMLIHIRAVFVVAPFLVGFVALQLLPEHFVGIYSVSTTVGLAASVWAIATGVPRQGSAS